MCMSFTTAMLIGIGGQEVEISGKQIATITELYLKISCAVMFRARRDKIFVEEWLAVTPGSFVCGWTPKKMSGVVSSGVARYTGNICLFHKPKTTSQTYSEV